MSIAITINDSEMLSGNGDVLYRSTTSLIFVLTKPSEKEYIGLGLY